MTDISVIVDDEPQAVTLTAAERGPKGDTGPAWSHRADRSGFDGSRPAGPYRSARLSGRGR